MYRPPGQRRYSHGEAGIAFKTANIEEPPNPSGALFEIFRIYRMLLATAPYFFPAFRILIPVHCLLGLLRSSILANSSSALDSLPGYCRLPPGYLNPIRPA